MAEPNDARTDDARTDIDASPFESAADTTGVEGTETDVAPTTTASTTAPTQSTEALPAEPASDEASPAEPALTEEELAAKEAEERLLVLFQSTVYGPHDEKIGKVGQVYLDDQTQEPNWVTVKTGFFGTKEFFVPLDLAERHERRINVPYDKATVTSAPRTEIDQNLSPEEEDELYAHYGVPGRVTDTAAAVESDALASDVQAADSNDSLVSPTDGPISDADASLGADSHDDTTDSVTTSPAEEPVDFSTFATEDAPVETPEQTSVLDEPSEANSPDGDAAETSPFERRD